MGRTKKSTNLDHRSNRLKLDIGIRHQTPLAAGFYLAYRRPRSGQAGAWLARWKDAGDKVDKQMRLGDAVDYADADGIRILSYAQAQKKAEDWFKEGVQLLVLERGEEVVPAGPYTIADAWADYIADAKRRGVKGAAVSRSVALSSEGVAWFTEFTRDREPDELMWRRGTVARTKRALLMRDPNAWTDYDQVFAMEKAVRAAGIAPVTFHELRHTHASGFINAGVPLVFVAKQLGHADTRMCERHCGHIARKDLAASIERLSPKLGLFEPAAGLDDPPR